MIVRIKLNNTHKEILSIDMSRVILINRHPEKTNLYIHFVDNHMQAIFYTWEEESKLIEDLQRLQLLHKIYDLKSSYPSRSYELEINDPNICFSDLLDIINNFYINNME